jgi:hypothetical protein
MSRSSKDVAPSKLDDMKLARIEHYRCGEPISWKNGSGYTYVWVPDDMSAEELDALCEAAQKSYLDTEAEFKKADPPYPPGYGAAISAATPDTMTVGELRKEYEAAAEAYKVHQELRDKHRKPFAWHLKEVSGGTVLQFWKNQPDLKVELDWGHNHGVTIEYSPTNIGDYPFPENDEDEL